MTSLFKYFPLLVVALAVVIDRFAVYCLNASSCPIANFLWLFFFEIIKPAYLFCIVFAVVAVLLIFVRQGVFISWLRFAMWGLPLSAIAVAVTPSTSSNWMPLYFVGKDTVALIAAFLFTIISLGIIGWKQFGSKK